MNTPAPGGVAAGHRPWPLVQVQLESQVCTSQSIHNKQFTKIVDLYLRFAWEDSFPFFTF
jgi:hypothetical protein